MGAWETLVLRCRLTVHWIQRPFRGKMGEEFVAVSVEISVFSLLGCRSYGGHSRVGCSLCWPNISTAWLFILSRRKGGIAQCFDAQRNQAWWALHRGQRYRSWYLTDTISSLGIYFCRQYYRRPLFMPGRHGRYDFLFSPIFALPSALSKLETDLYLLHLFLHP